ncbi:MAG: hypothetical protein M9937_16425 [Chelatococcus sp.]|nr:hypothetical protein [Chelatococcus sp.]
MSQANWPRLMLRLPTDLKRFMMREAKRNGSSQNSEIVRAIREKLDRMKNDDGAHAVESRSVVAETKPPLAGGPRNHQGCEGASNG